MRSAGTTTNPRSGARRARPGFTIVELIVAVMILSVGVLGLASASAVMMRQMTGGVSRARAANLAQSRFDSVASVPNGTSTGCNTFGALNNVTTGSATTRGVQERWRVTRTGSFTVTVLDSVRLPRATAWLPFETVVRCQP